MAHDDYPNFTLTSTLGHMTNDTAGADVHADVAAFFLNSSNNAKLYTHEASRTSEESMEARYKASGERVVGAKAILIKLDVKDRSDVFAVVLLPGFNRLDSKALKEQLRERISGMRNFRFATAEEMARVARDVQPGKMPPIGRPIFPDIQYTFIDNALLEHEKVGFNAAHFERSIILPTKQLIDIVPADGYLSCSTVGEAIK